MNRMFLVDKENLTLLNRIKSDLGTAYENDIEINFTENGFELSHKKINDCLLHSIDLDENDSRERFEYLYELGAEVFDEDDIDVDYDELDDELEGPGYRVYFEDRVDNLSDDFYEVERVQITDISSYFDIKEIIDRVNCYYDVCDLELLSVITDPTNSDRVLATFSFEFESNY